MQIGPTVRVYTIGFGMALIATFVVIFILSLIGAVIDEFAMGDFTSGCYVAMATFVVGGSAGAMMLNPSAAPPSNQATIVSTT